MTADRLTFSAQYGYILRNDALTLAGATATIGVWIKRESGNTALALRATGAGTTYLQNITVTNDWAYYTATFTHNGTNNLGFMIEDRNASGFGSILIWGAHLYRSDLQMQLNPAMPAGMQSYYPTSVANRLGYTETFSNAAWVGLNGGASAPTKGTVSGTKPNGLTGTIDTLTIPAVSAGQWSAIYQNAGATFANVPITFSVYARVSSGTATIYLNVEDIGAGPSAGNFIASTAKTLDSTWQRISITGTRTSTTGNSIVVIGFDTRCGAGQTNASSITIELWGAQLSDSASLDTYVPQYGAAVTSAAYYAPRLDFDGATLAAKGLLVEELRTNFVINSEAFTGSGWVPVGSPTIAANNDTSPAGVQTGTRFTLTGSTGGVYRTTTIASGTVVTASLYIKAVTSSLNVVLTITDNSLDYTLTVNASTGAFVSATTGISSYTITSVGSGWYRITSTRTLAAANPNIFIGCTSGASTNAFILWGAQIEAGSFATSYIPTGSATATRAADVASVSTQAFPYSSTEGSLVVSVTSLSAAASIGNFLVLSQGDAATNRIALSRNNATQLLYRVANGGSTQFSLYNAMSASASKIGAAFTDGDFASVVNGGAAQTTSTGTLPTTIDKMHIGKYPTGSGDLNGHIRQITYLPRRISNAELQQRTSN